MPPIPLPVHSLASRLTALLDANRSVNQLIQRLSRLDFPPGSLPPGSDEGDVRVELSAEIHDTLKQLEEDLELLRQEVEEATASTGSGRRRESDRDRDKTRLAVLLARATEDLRTSRIQFRKAQLKAKRNADLSKQKEREILFANLRSGSSTPTKSRPPHRQQTQQLTADEVVANASSDVTAALRRTHQLMQTELSRSRFAQETLEQSTAALASLGEKYSDLGTLLANSKSLVGTLLSSQKSDTWYLETAFYILGTTLTWLVFRRWLYGPLWWCIWLPLKLIYTVVFWVFGIVGLLGGTNTRAVAPRENPSIRSGTFSTSISFTQRPTTSSELSSLGSTSENHEQSSAQKTLIDILSTMADSGHQKEQTRAQQTGSAQVHGSSGGAQAPPEPSAQQATRQHGAGAVSPGLPVRGDGTVLQDSDKPRNPKKRMWDENVEQAKRQQELAQKQSQVQAPEHAAAGERPKDEL